MSHRDSRCRSKVGGSADPTMSALGDGYEPLGQRGARGLPQGPKSCHPSTTASEIQGQGGREERLGAAPRASYFTFKEDACFEPYTPDDAEPNTQNSWLWSRTSGTHPGI